MISHPPIEFSLRSNASSITFREFEVPQQLVSLGGKVLHSLYQFPGGRREVDTFGAVPPDSISWEGIIMGSDGYERLSEIDGLRAHAPVTLTYGPFRYSGILSEFLAVPGFLGYIPYRATFIPTKQTGYDLVPDKAKPSLDLGAQAALAALNMAVLKAQAQAANIALFQAMTGILLSGVELATNILSQYGGSVVLASQEAPIPLGLASQAVASGAAWAQAALSAIVGGTSIAVPPALAAQAGMAAAIAYAQPVQIPNTDMPKYQTLMKDMFVSAALLANFMSVASRATKVVIVVVDPNLIELAVKYYGDPDSWGIIADANNLTGWDFTGVYSLVIPEGT